MTIELLEYAVDDLSSYLQAQMAAKVAALNARHGDTLLDDIKTYYIGNMPLSLPEAPAIVLQGESTEPREQRVANLMSTNNITVFVFVGDDNVENRYRKLCRYAVGVVELLRAGEGTMGYVVAIRGAMALTEPMNTQPFLQAITVPISMTQMENY
jgi:hypothetical protein